MSCRCLNCDWPIYTPHAVALKCYKCATMVHCGESESIAIKTPENKGDKWPPWALAVAKLKTDADIGVGDTVSRYAALVGGEALKLAASAMGMPCGCTARQQQWNALYPYPKNQ